MFRNRGTICLLVLAGVGCVMPLMTRTGGAALGPATASSVESATQPAANLPAEGLIVDLDADSGVTLEGERVVSWTSAVDWKARVFTATRPDGKPSLHKNVAALRGHNALDFKKQELVNDDEDAFDPLITGAGYTWCCVLAPHQQVEMEKDVDAFFGNLKNGGNYEGFWGCLNDDNTVWNGSRNGITFGRFDPNNPKVTGPKLELNRFYVLAGRMQAGAGVVKVELFVNSPDAVASQPFPVNPEANSSKMAIGQERDAQNHPGRESFKGELARIVFWQRPLSQPEMQRVVVGMKQTYGIE